MSDGAAEPAPADATAPSPPGGAGTAAGSGGAAARRERLLALLLCAAGAGLVVAAAGRTWATATIALSGPLPPIRQSLTGRELSGVVAALGLAGLAGLAALIATRGWVRVVVGVLLAGFGVAITAASITAIRHGHVAAAVAEKSSFARVGTVAVTQSSWWAVSVTGGLLLALAGILVAARGRRWPGMSARYDPAGTAPSVDTSADDPARLWRSLDHGQDPT